MIRVGLTGGIASGKTVACRRFMERGVTVIDYDSLAREVVAPGTPGLAEIVEAFGDQYLKADGSLDRASLGRRIFADDSDRQTLETIVHPRVIARGQEMDVAAQDRGERLVVHDIPLLVEAVGVEPFDVVIVVDAPETLRIDRLIARGLSDDQARARIDSQATDDVRLSAADVVFDGSGTVTGLQAQVDDWLKSLGGRPSQD